MNSYILARDAEQDLDDLWDYIAADNVEAADRLTARLLNPSHEILGWVTNGKT